ncbi:UNVERIFIED_CONTAM: hypothetical protein FKN15_046303 [Acipenser sinensis]
MIAVPSERRGYAYSQRRGADPVVEGMGPSAFTRWYLETQLGPQPKEQSWDLNTPFPNAQGQQAGTPECKEAMLAVN